MKKLISLVIALGFVIMIGAAGSVEYVNMSFFKALFLELFGMFVVLCGTSAMMHYKRYERRMRAARRRSRRCSQTSVCRAGSKIRLPEKELC